MAASTKRAPRMASMAKPAPLAAPTAATPQRVAAVLMPRMLPDSRMMTPAPRKPMPETI
ncbi:hypothetical protein D3C84_852260 [compost metagenome]